ncbi:MAG: R3H domain-containing nucleic acid-binding protein [Patescibacteria group bacterium]
MIKSFFAEWPVRPEIDLEEIDSNISIKVRTGRDFMFVQPNPQPVLALQHLWRIIFKTKFPDLTYRLIVDIGNFRDTQQKNIDKLVTEAIWQLKASGNAVHMMPMSSFERRLVHSKITEETGLVSGSEGVGPDRHVVIRVSGK